MLVWLTEGILRGASPVVTSSALLISILSPDTTAECGPLLLVTSDSEERAKRS